MFINMLERLEGDGWKSIHNTKWKYASVNENTPTYSHRRAHAKLISKRLVLSHEYTWVYATRNPALTHLAKLAHKGMPFDTDPRIRGMYATKVGATYMYVSDILEYLKVNKRLLVLGLPSEFQSMDDYHSLNYPLMQALQNYDLGYDTFRLICWIDE